MRPNVHSSTIYNRQDMEATLGVRQQVKICIDMYVYIYIYTHIHTIEYYSAIKKNEIMASVATWRDPEIIILNEVTQRKTNTV